MPAPLSPKEDSNEHARQQQQANDEYNKVIFFHSVLYYKDNRLWELARVSHKDRRERAQVCVDARRMKKNTGGAERCLSPLYGHC